MEIIYHQQEKPRTELSALGNAHLCTIEIRACVVDDFKWYGAKLVWINNIRYCTITSSANLQMNLSCVITWILQFWILLIQTSLAPYQLKSSTTQALISMVYNWAKATDGIY